MISITLNMTYNGQHLIDAIQKISENPVVREVDTILGPAFSLGQTSHRPYEQIAIRADDNNHIYPHLTYQTFTVTEDTWADADGIEYEPLDVVDYMLDFSRRLYLELLNRPDSQSNSQLKAQSLVNNPRL